MIIDQNFLNQIVRVHWKITQMTTSGIVNQMKPCQDNKIIAKTVASVFGGAPKVLRYRDETEEYFVDILSSRNCPRNGIESHSTVNLSDYSIDFTYKDIPVRVELLGACGTNYALFANMMSTCAFCVIKDAHPCFPGSIFHDVVKMYYPSYSMKHVMIVPPFLWDGKFRSVEFKTKQVAWLLMVPISESECRFAEVRGSDSLESVFEKEQIDIFDLSRASVIKENSKC
jgi:hypothetical protein